MGKREQHKTILIINLGSTSTKLAIFKNHKEFSSHTYEHSASSLKPYDSMWDQLDYRQELLFEFLENNKIEQDSLSLVMGRGGMLKPLESGVYRINDKMLHELKAAVYGEHASNLGAPLAYAVAKRYNCEAFIADPVVVDELAPLARVSGLNLIERKSIFHALNQKYVARLAAKELGKPYEMARLIVAHMGGGISVASHIGGKIVDVNNALDGDGPFSGERSGALPVGDLIRLTKSNRYSVKELMKMVVGEGGLYSYTQIKDVKELYEKGQKGDKNAQFYFDALIYQTAKEIASHFAVLEGVVDSIVLTGGMAHNEAIVSALKKRVGFLSQILVFAGEREMASLAENGYAVLDKKRKVSEYE
jgi:butyrate kinase